MKEEVRNRLEAIKKVLLSSDKEKILCLSTTANINNPPLYFSAIRETKETISGNVIFSELLLLEEVTGFFDGLVDYFLIDVEIKSGMEDFVEQAKSFIKKSKVHFFKPNDITVDALDEFISCLLGDLGGLTAVIVGGGNIGAKIALRICERGADVIVCGRDLNKTGKIVEGISLIKRGNGTLKASDDILSSSSGAGLLLGCTPGVPSIGSSIIKELGEQAVVIDVGNGTISEDGIKEAISRDLRLYCFSMLCGFHGFISTWKKSSSYISKIGRKKLNDDVSVVTPGIMGGRGEIIVNNIDNIEQVIGVCNGKGDLLSEKESQVFLERFNTYVKRK